MRLSQNERNYSLVTYVSGDKSHLPFCKIYASHSNFGLNQASSINHLPPSLTKLVSVGTVFAILF